MSENGQWVGCCGSIHVRQRLGVRGSWGCYNCCEFEESLKMVVTADVYLPPEEELTVQEVNLSGPALRAGAFHYGKYCEFENNVRVLMFFQ